MYHSDLEAVVPLGTAAFFITPHLRRIRLSRERAMPRTRRVPAYGKETACLRPGNKLFHKLGKAVSEAQASMRLKIRDDFGLSGRLFGRHVAALHHDLLALG